MEKIQQWSRVISLVSVVSAVIIALIPESKLKSTYKTLTGLIIIYSAISAVFSFEKADFDFTNEMSEVSSYVNEETDSMLMSQGTELLNSAVCNKLAENGIEARCESIIIYEGESMVVESVTLYGDLTKEEKGEAEGILKDMLGDKTKLYFKGEQ